MKNQTDDRPAVRYCDLPASEQLARTVKGLEDLRKEVQEAPGVSIRFGRGGIVVVSGITRVTVQ